MRGILVFFVCATISSCVLVFNLAMLTDCLSFDGKSVCSRLSIMLLAFSSKALSAPWFSASKNSIKFMVLGPKTSRCLLCFAVPCYSVFTYFRQKMTNTSSKV